MLRNFGVKGIVNSTKMVVIKSWKGNWLFFETKAGKSEFQ
jgi:hypothetical protein